MFCVEFSAKHFAYTMRGTVFQHKYVGLNLFLFSWGTLLLTSAFSDMVLPIRVGNCSLSIDREKVATIVPSLENYFLLEKDSFLLNE